MAKTKVGDLLEFFEAGTPFHDGRGNLGFELRGDERSLNVIAVRGEFLIYTAMEHGHHAVYGTINSRDKAEELLRWVEDGVEPRDWGPVECLEESDGVVVGGIATLAGLFFILVLGMLAIGRWISGG